jgi:hypothetical protein
VRQHLSRAFDEIAPQLKVEPRALLNDVAPIAERVQADLPPAEANRFNQLVDQASRKTNFKDAEEYLTGWINKYSGQGASPDTIALSESLDEVLTTARNSLARQTPALASRLRAINEGWANYAIIRKAAAQSGGREGVFTPEALNNAVKSRQCEKEHVAWDNSPAARRWCRICRGRRCAYSANGIPIAVRLAAWWQARRYLERWASPVTSVPKPWRSLAQRLCLTWTRCSVALQQPLFFGGQQEQQYQEGSPDWLDKLLLLALVLYWLKQVRHDTW